MSVQRRLRLLAHFVVDQRSRRSGDENLFDRWGVPKLMFERSPEQGGVADVRVLVTELKVQGQDYLAALEQIAAVVTKVTIRRYTGDRLYLPAFPAQVKTLKLVEVRVREPVTFPEGLEEIKLIHVASDNLLSWVFPSTLQLLTAKKCARRLDLRSVTAPAIKLLSLWDDAILPEALDELTISRDPDQLWEAIGFPDTADDEHLYRELDDIDTRLVWLPPYLRVLKIDGFDEILSPDSVRATQFSGQVTISNIDCRVDATKAFPLVENLTLDEVNFSSQLTLSRLTSLVIKDSWPIEPITFDAPLLESLSIINREEEALRLNEVGTLGETLLALTLSGVQTFPVVEEWERLQSVTIEYSAVDLEIPFIRYLRELELDRAYLTRGVRVENIMEYGQAWGMRQKKGAKRQ